MLRDIEALIKRNAIKLSDREIGNLLDERDRFDMHYYDHLGQKDRVLLTKLFNFYDDSEYIKYLGVFLNSLSPKDAALRCPNCRSLIFPDKYGHFPCPECQFKPAVGKRTFVHCNHH